MDHSHSFIDKLDSNYICHHGIKGQRWGVRRYQNPDGSLTPKGRKRYKKSLDYISTIKQGNNLIRDIVNEQYATSKNNYEVNKKAKQEMIDSGSHTEESFKKMYPYYNAGMNYDKRTAEYYKDKILSIDVMNKKLSDIDVTSQSFKKTKKLVDNIIDEATAYNLDLNDRYSNSREVKEWNDINNKTQAHAREAKKRIVNKYSL